MVRRPVGDKPARYRTRLARTAMAPDPLRLGRDGRMRGRVWLRRAGWGYLAALHVGLAWIAAQILFRPWATDLVWGPTLRAQDYGARTVHQARRATQLAGGLAVLGDSIVEDMAVGALHPGAENFGMGGDTVAQVAWRAARLDLSGAGAVLLHAGINDWNGQDFKGIGEAYARLLAAIPPGLPVIVSGILPVDPERAPRFAGVPERLGAAHAEIGAACATRPGCRFVTAGGVLAGPDGRLRPEHSIGDGVHLNAGAYRLLAFSLRAALVDAAPGLRGSGRESSASPGAPPPG